MYAYLPSHGWVVCSKSFEQKCWLQKTPSRHVQTHGFLGHPSSHPKWLGSQSGPKCIPRLRPELPCPLSTGMCEHRLTLNLSSISEQDSFITLIHQVYPGMRLLLHIKGWGSAAMTSNRTEYHSHMQTSTHSPSTHSKLQILVQEASSLRSTDCIPCNVRYKV